MNKFVTIAVTSEIKKQIEDYYSDFQIENNGEYISFQARKGDVIITTYDSKKDLKKVTFQGEQCLKEALKFDSNASYNETKKTFKEDWINTLTQIGSDEVGCGDFFGPMIVVAAFVRNSDIKALKEFGVHDSKKMSDEEIMDLGPKLAKRFFVSKLVLSNEKYNEMVTKGENLNSLKAKMHNRALLNLLRKFPDTKYIFVDQFASPTTYYKYLNDENEMKVTNITFKQKGESYFPSVALASVMARYSFLLEMDKLNKKYNTKFPFGASKKVDSFASSFVKKYGLDEIRKLVKVNFVNYRKIIQ